MRDEKKILGRACPKCQRVFCPPESLCSFCFEKTDQWVELSGEGTLLSFTVIHQPWPDLPFPPPVIYGLFHLLGSDTNLVHLLGEIEIRDGEFYSLDSQKRRAKLEGEPGLGGITRNLNIYKPIIAAVNGAALGGGLELALSCDIRIAAENATFGLPEVKWGIMPGAGGTQRLPRLVPLGKAVEMIFTGQAISAQEACGIGLVRRVVPSGELMASAIEMAERICENGPLAVRAAKEALMRGLDMNLDEALRLEQFLADPLRGSEDAKEGIQAFKEKRKPNREGKAGKIKCRAGGKGGENGVRQR